MNEDRLKHFKNTLDVMVNDESEMHRNRLKDAAFHFYKQAIERVQELEKRLKMYQKRSWFEDYEKVAKQNKRYREALEFYADEETYEEIKYEAVYQGGVPIEPPSGEPPLIYYDKGKAARKALEGESDE